MKQIILIIFVLSLMLSFCGCEGKLVNTEWKEVEALVINAHYNNRFGTKTITVAYENTTSRWQNDNLYDYYVNRLGETISCILVTYTYENGCTNSELLFNQDLWDKMEE